MIIGRYTNQPHEQRLRDIVYSEFLLAGETITSAAVTFERVSGDAEEVIPFAVTATVIGGNTVRYLAVGGADLSLYKLTFLVTTTLQVKEDEVEIWVEEL